MSKKKNSDLTDAKKSMAKLLEQISKKKFESEGELRDFLSTIEGQSIDDIVVDNDDADDDNDKWQAQELLYESYEKPITEARKLVKKALKLDPNNADAYNALGDMEKNLDKAIDFYEKAIAVAEQTLGKEIFKEERGHFWLMIETRPYMRAKERLADCLCEKNKIDEAIKIYDEMLDLNHNDNQGVRYILSTLLLSENNFADYEVLLNKYPDERMAAWRYNKALYHFKKSGKTAAGEKALLDAYESNKYAIDYLVGNKKLPKVLPEYMGIGDDKEAVHYTNDSGTAWVNTAGALAWLVQFKQKLRNLN